MFFGALCGLCLSLVSCDGGPEKGVCVYTHREQFNSQEPYLVYTCWDVFVAEGQPAEGMSLQECQDGCVGVPADNYYCGYFPGQSCGDLGFDPNWPAGTGVKLNEDDFSKQNEASWQLPEKQNNPPPEGSCVELYTWYSNDPSGWEQCPACLTAHREDNADTSCEDGKIGMAYTIRHDGCTPDQYRNKWIKLVLTFDHSSPECFSSEVGFIDEEWLIAFSTQCMPSTVLDQQLWCPVP
jgi:hypothetical protein